MRKNLKIKVFSLLLCLVFVFLCSCDLGITPAQTEEDETREAGFSDIQFYGRLRMTPPRAGDDRWHVAAKKP